MELDTAKVVPGRHASFPISLNALIKRVIDVLAALIGLILLFPLFILIGFWIKLDSPGPILFWGPRMGRNGKPFRMVKFRTMYERPESYQGPSVTADGDDRITPLGHWLRNTKINELPQLWNVLTGEMSLVGPRPEDVKIARDWPKDAFQEILSARPGITSPASILYHDEEKMLSKTSVMADYVQSILPDKIRLDRLYVRHHSFVSDLDIIFWTIAVILPQLSKTSIPERYLFAGPISRLINRYVSWFLIDFLVSTAAVYLASVVWTVRDWASLDPNYLLALALALALLFSGLNLLVGLDRVLWSTATLDDGIRLTVSVSAMTTLLCMISYAGQGSPGPLGSLPPADMVLFAGLAAGLGMLVARFRLRLLAFVARRWVNWRQDVSEVGERVLLIGRGEGAKLASYLLRQAMFRTAFSVVGSIDNINPSHYGMRVGGNWVLGGIKDIPSLLERYDIGIMLSTIPHQDPENDQILDISRASKTRLIFLDDLLSMTERQISRPRGPIDTQIWVNGYLEYKAMYDSVTGLPNRFLLQDRFRHAFANAKRNKTRPGLILIEFDQVKEISGTLGVNIGNQTILELAKRLENCKRESDTLARYGFAKFALLVEHLPSECEGEIIIQRIASTFSAPFDVHGHEVFLKPDTELCIVGQPSDAKNQPGTADITKFSEWVMSKITNDETTKHYESTLER